MKKVSILIPCLNEQKTLPLIIPKLKTVEKKLSKNYHTEIIFIDNQSNDNSLDIINKSNFKVLTCQERGYGATLKHGIDYVEDGIIIFADADNTYDFNDVPKLIYKLENTGSDLVLGNRLNKSTKSNAMPFSHRYFGTPFLSFLINTFFSNSSNKIKDCNSGFRCFFKNKYNQWKPNSNGMEFASEMLILAQKNNAKIKELEIQLHSDIDGRIKHLKTWKDGMRHLLIILSYCPSFFFKLSIIGFLFSWLILIASYIFGRQSIVTISIFDIHTMLFCALLSFLSSSIWGIGMILEDPKNIKNSYYKFFMSLNEDKLFFITVSNIILFIFSILYVFLIWLDSNMIFLNLQKELIIIMTFLGTAFNINIFCINYFALRSNNNQNK